MDVGILYPTKDCQGVSPHVYDFDVFVNSFLGGRGYVCSLVHCNEFLVGNGPVLRITLNNVTFSITNNT